MRTRVRGCGGSLKWGAEHACACKLRCRVGRSERVRACVPAFLSDGCLQPPLTPLSPLTPSAPPDLALFTVIADVSILTLNLSLMLKYTHVVGGGRG